jgi:hypothetical protein
VATLICFANGGCDETMIPKNGNRSSEKIMLKKVDLDPIQSDRIKVESQGLAMLAPRAGGEHVFMEARIAINSTGSRHTRAHPRSIETHYRNSCSPQSKT